MAPMEHPASPDTVLSVHGLSHRYGTRQALDGIDFHLNEGEVKIVLGPNGAGKTTLFALITGLFRAHQGTVRIFGKSIAENPTWALSRIGVVFQQPSLDLDLSVAENLRYHGALQGLSRAETDARAGAQLTRLGIANRKADRVRDLNGGHRRRVELARALLGEPRLLLLDEPTVGLDIQSRTDMVNDVHRLATADGVAVLWATHLIDEVHPEDRLLVMHNGRTAADGPCTDVIAETGAADLASAYGILTRDAGTA